jgi:hypothetical protein
MQGKTDIFYGDVQRYIAATTIGPSALRNQGGPGVIERAQRFLSELDIRTLAASDEESFLQALDTATAELQQWFPVHYQ